MAQLLDSLLSVSPGWLSRNWPQLCFSHGAWGSLPSLEEPFIVPLSMAYFIVEVLAPLSYPHHICCAKGRNCLLHLGFLKLNQEVPKCWYFPLQHFLRVTKERVISGYIFLPFCHRTCLLSSHLAVLFPVW